MCCSMLFLRSSIILFRPLRIWIHCSYLARSIQWGNCYLDISGASVDRYSLPRLHLSEYRFYTPGFLSVPCIVMSSFCTWLLFSLWNKKALYSILDQIKALYSLSRIAGLPRPGILYIVYKN
jgi:hypothetical protein